MNHLALSQMKKQNKSDEVKGFSFSNLIVMEPIIGITQLVIKYYGESFSLQLLKTDQQNTKLHKALKLGLCPKIQKTIFILFLCSLNQNCIFSVYLARAIFLQFLSCS